MRLKGSPKEIEQNQKLLYKQNHELLYKQEKHIDCYTYQKQEQGHSYLEDPVDATACPEGASHAVKLMTDIKPPEPVQLPWPCQQPPANQLLQLMHGDRDLFWPYRQALSGTEFPR